MGNVRDNNNIFVFLIKVVLIGIDFVLFGILYFDKICIYIIVSWLGFVLKKIKEFYFNLRYVLKI